MTPTTTPTSRPRKWAGERVLLSEALTVEPVGLVRRDDHC